MRVWEYGEFEQILKLVHVYLGGIDRFELEWWKFKGGSGYKAVHMFELGGC